MLARTFSPATLAVMFVVCLAFGSDAKAEIWGHHGQGIVCREYQYGNPDLFYNFYVPPTCGGVGAALYPAPLPVPAYVGQTYITYQPFMPHEFLYQHHRSYHRYYNEGRGLTRTCVHWW